MSLCLDGNQNIHLQILNTLRHTSGLFDHSPLIKVLEKYVDFNKLQPNGNPNSRLIITAVNVLTAEPLIFDSTKQQITSKHILATTGYPTYYFRWAEVEMLGTEIC